MGIVKKPRGSVTMYQIVVANLMYSAVSAAEQVAYTQAIRRCTERLRCAQIRSHHIGCGSGLRVSIQESDRLVRRLTQLT
jgi:hypothetical protein